jgi:hypothetical protein
MDKTTPANVYVSVSSWDYDSVAVEVFLEEIVVR